jgi:hypothetical protein
LLFVQATTISTNALGTGTVTGNPKPKPIGGAAADTLSRAIMRAIRAAKGIHIGTCNVNSYCELFPRNCTR